MRLRRQCRSRRATGEGAADRRLSGGTDAGDADTEANTAALLQALQQLGWIEGRNLKLDVRLSGGESGRVRRNIAGLLALSPDLVLTAGASALAPLLQATRTVPIVFVNIPDPVGAGYVRRLSRPGGNATGFVSYEYSVSAKWLELLKEIAPSVMRAGVLRDPSISSGTGQFAVIQSVASSAGIEVTPVNLQDVNDIKGSIAEIADAGNGGLILTAGAPAIRHGGLIIDLATRHKLPMVCFRRRFVDSGGLISYGPDVPDQYRRAASYIDRILKGEKPADLAVQAPTKYEL